MIHIDDTDHNAKEGDTFFSPRHTKHRALGGPEGLTFLEIAFGEFGENDNINVSKIDTLPHNARKMNDEFTISEELARSA